MDTQPSTVYVDNIDGGGLAITANSDYRQSMAPPTPPPYRNQRVFEAPAPPTSTPPPLRGHLGPQSSDEDVDGEEGEELDFSAISRGDHTTSGTGCNIQDDAAYGYEEDYRRLPGNDSPVQDSPSSLSNNTAKNCSGYGSRNTDDDICVEHTELHNDTTNDRVEVCFFFYWLIC